MRVRTYIARREPTGRFSASTLWVPDNLLVCGHAAGAQRCTLHRFGAGRSSVGICGRSTALHLASLYGHPKTAMALIKAGADVRCTDSDGYGPGPS